MINIIQSSINRDKLYNREYEGTLKVIKQNVDNESMESFYVPLAKLLTLIYEMK